MLHGSLPSPKQESRKALSIGGTCVVAPTGQIVAQATTLEDELVVARCDLDLTQRLRQATLNFSAHRRIEHYELIARRTGFGTPDGEDED